MQCPPRKARGTGAARARSRAAPAFSVGAAFSSPPSRSQALVPQTPPSACVAFTGERRGFADGKLGERGIHAGEEVEEARAGDAGGVAVRGAGDDMAAEGHRAQQAPQAGPQARRGCRTRADAVEAARGRATEAGGAVVGAQRLARTSVPPELRMGTQLAS